MREQVILVCEKCKRENYITSKNKTKHTKRMVVRKYCPHSRTHEIHKEAK